MFQGEEIACTQPPHVLLDLGAGNFAVGVWVYMIDVTAEQTVFCKQMMHADGTESMRYCFKVLAGAPVITINEAILPTDPGVTEDLTLGMLLAEGWNYVLINNAVNGFLTNSVNGYVRRSDGFTYDSSTVIAATARFVDSDQFILCIGAKLLSLGGGTWDVEFPLVGMVHRLSFYSGTVFSTVDANSAISTACDICLLCENGVAPMCFEQVPATFLTYWDFAQPTYMSSVPDQGVQGYALPLVDDYLTTDPIYVHNAGFHFDGSKYLDFAPFDLGGRESFSVETWMRLEGSTSFPNGYLFALEYSAGGGDYFAIRVQPANRVRVYIRGQSRVMTVNIVSGLVNQWFMLGVSVIKTGPSTSTVCVKLNVDLMSCDDTYTRVIPDEGTQSGRNLRIGQAYTGYIKSMKVYDYPKMDPQFNVDLRINASGECTVWNGSFCEVCETITANKQCYTHCAAPAVLNQYDPDCKTCHSFCQSCFGPEWFTCYSCYDPDYTYDIPTTSCLEICGDGFNEGT